MRLELPLQSYPARAEGSVPVTLYYSSKVWRMQYVTCVAARSNVDLQYATNYTVDTGVYGDASASGWTSSLTLPVIQTGNGRYDSDGNPCCVDSGQDGGYHVPRIHVLMPDGSSHELRRDDNYHAGPDLGTGAYYSVDGSRLIYQSNAPNSSTPSGTLYLPDGSRYLLNAPDATGNLVSEHIDRNGNIVWNGYTDALGRSIQDAIPGTGGIGNSAPGPRR